MDVSIILNLFSCLAAWVTALVTAGAVYYAHRTLVASFSERANKERPFVYIDVNTPSHNVCNLEVKNIGGSPAINLKIKFDPNIEYYDDHKVNDINLFKNLSFLAPDKHLDFFFGMFSEDKILQKFSIDLEYEDLSGKKYSETQQLDLNEYLGRLSITDHGLDDIYEMLKDISKSFDRSVRSGESINQSLKDGINVRSNSYSAESYMNMIVNLYEKTSETNLWLRPFIYDFNYNLFKLRESLLIGKIVSSESKEIIDLLDLVLINQKVLSPDVYKSKVEQLVRKIQNHKDYQYSSPTSP